MPAVPAIAAFGTIIQLGDTSSPTVYTNIANLDNIKFSGMKQANVDVTSHSSGIPWNQKMPTLIDGGDVSFDLYYDPAQPTHNASTGLLYCLVNRATRFFKMIFPTSPVSTFTFQAFVASFPLDAAANSVLKATVMLTISGQVVIT